jgi:protein-S-isoprenylcysteine O-methyltransferase Ste14
LFRIAPAASSLDRDSRLGHHDNMHQRDETSPPIVLGLAQLLRKRLLLLATVALSACFVVFGSRWPDGYLVHKSIESVGILLIGICIVGRTWSSFYIAGRKDVSLVMIGPYSVCRNPLYVFSILGAAGVGAQLGSIVIMVLVGLLAWFVFDLVVREEEKSLEEVYGRPYREYCARVPRFLPRFSQWQGVSTIEIDMRRVTRTFVDACVFLLAIPLAEVLEYFQDTGAITVLFRLP